MKKAEMKVNKAAEETAKENTPAATQNTEVEALKAQVKKLEAALKNQPQSLEEKIEYYRLKQEQMRRLSVLDTCAENLMKVAGDVQEKQQEDEFFTENYSLRVTHKHGYSSESDVLKIHNTSLITEVLDFALNKINEKRDALRIAIEA